jgi:hypothetical protein
VAWYISLFTGTDTTTVLVDFHATPPPSLSTVISAAASYNSTFSIWSAAHAPQITSLASVCPSQVANERILGWDLEDVAIWSAVSSGLPSQFVPSEWVLSLPTGTGTPTLNALPTATRQSSTTHTNNNSELHTVLIVVGIILLIIALIFIFCRCIRRCARRKREGQEQLYSFSNCKRRKKLPYLSSLARGRQSSAKKVFVVGAGDSATGEVRPGKEEPVQGWEWRPEPEVMMRVLEAGQSGDESHDTMQRASRHSTSKSELEMPPPAHLEDESRPFLSDKSLEQ